MCLCCHRAYLSEFLSNDLALAEEGFALATLQTALAYLDQLGGPGIAAPPPPARR
jgi:hypothetical protein